MNAESAPSCLAPSAGRSQRVGLYGATGRLGRITAPLIDRPGVTVVIGGRNESRVSELFAQPWCDDAYAFNPSQQQLLREFVAQCRVVVNCAGPRVSAELALAAIEAGADFIDSSDGLLQPSPRHDIDRIARACAVAVVPCAGLDRLLLDLYAAIVAKQTQSAAVDTQLHVETDRVIVAAFDIHGRALRKVTLPGTDPHAISAYVIAEAVRCALEGDLLASGILDWKAFVPELFMEAMPFDELWLAHRDFGTLLPQDIFL